MSFLQDAMMHPPNYLKQNWLAYPQCTETQVRIGVARFKRIWAARRHFLQPKVCKYFSFRPFFRCWSLFLGTVGVWIDRVLWFLCWDPEFDTQKMQTAQSCVPFFVGVIEFSIVRRCGPVQNIMVRNQNAGPGEDEATVLPGPSSYPQVESSRPHFVVLLGFS